ncbi:MULTISPECIES: plasmid partitioning protein RepB [unclassified Ensifer]|uniref:plasmid partitioning protein RepB n=1 Tax=unclassified Ensifer TaxID=2633371 RepID=UPI000812C912|nr:MULTISPECIES: plasmid partitioning protein RepB [unclassified Ensifer]OCP08401.1 plasmid partitioning protein RepB [Ensifer sp. LC11]OCP09020.1 plasmid partitioning protein RepB [Ensifer sp. LC13]OCP09803.1 plasmid partitioning protein RepB [Ensifer sp. LC14]OCP32290.1 plasmid partitioning protein RepB [Ensifer sp. LC499]
MARKNLLAGLVDAAEIPQADVASAYPMRGASKSMVRSLDELSRQAEKFLEGETVVELDPETVEGSFVSDRMDDDREQFEALKQAIAERGQDTPILVRPHPTADGRYQIVFGHRRARAARELGRKVKAVVRALDDRTHVIAQGQENSARADLTFIERALFARRLEALGYDRAVISSSLAANAAAVSKMMSVTERIAPSLIESIGPAPSVGRERWVELSLLVGKQANANKVAGIVGDSQFQALSSDERFGALFGALNKTGKPVKKTSTTTKDAWQTADKAVSAQYSNSGKAFALSMKSRNAGRFGQYLADNLDRLYAEFLAANDGKDD